MRTILWTDWPYLLKHREQLVSLDNVLSLTYGKPLSLPHLLSAVHPTDYLFTGVCEAENSSEKSIAQIYRPTKSNSAKINYLLLPENSDLRNLVPLLEHLIKQAGSWGAKQVIADIDINSVLFTHLRAAGFSVLAKQKIFKVVKSDKTPIKGNDGWRVWNHADIKSMRSLYHTLVPPLIQSVEPLTRREMIGMVYYDSDGTLQAYADLLCGPVGAWVLPIIHPQAKEEKTGLLQKMIMALPTHHKRPIYITTRSYQPWIEQALLDLPALPGPEQALMVRYIALQQRVKTEFGLNPIDNGTREPTVPYIPSNRSD